MTPPTSPSPKPNDVKKGDHIKEDNKGQQSNTPNKMEEDRTQHGINGIEKENQTEAKLGKRHLFTLCAY